MEREDKQEKRENRRTQKQRADGKGGRDRDRQWERGKKWTSVPCFPGKFYFGEPAPWRPHPTSPPPGIAHS